MGGLVLPQSGSVYVDANVIIYRIERVTPYSEITVPLWEALDADQQQIITSELSVLEVLVKPFQLGNITLVNLFQTVLYGTLGFTCLPITGQTLKKAAQLRATTGLKTPDAIHAAAALNAGCSLFITNDPIFRRVSGLSVAVLNEI